MKLFLIEQIQNNPICRDNKMLSMFSFAINLNNRQC